MDLFLKTKSLCLENNIRPSRSRGQNFLINEEIHDQIVDIADIQKHDVVLEVGPGLGFLTEKLAKKARKVIAVEIDQNLSKLLVERLENQNINNVEIVNEDILKPISYEEIPIIKKITRSGYKVVANLPYNITSIFFRRILSARYKPDSMVIMVQKEVAERIVADPNSKKASPMSLLAVSIQFYANPKIVARVNRDNFWPKPKVDSAILQLEIDKGLDPSKMHKSGQAEINEERFFEIVRAGFSAKRKMLKNNLAKGLGLNVKDIEEKFNELGFDKKIRAQELTVDNWMEVFTKLKK